MLKIDLHIHSKYSFDSFMEINKIINVAKRKGLNGVAITDHNTTKGCFQAAKCVKHGSFLVICGSEIPTDKGEIIGLFLEEDVKSRQALEVMQEIKSQGGVCILAHPFKRLAKIDEDVLRQVDALEGFNARSTVLQNHLAQEVATRYNLPITAGSDAHFYFEIGRGVTLIKEKEDEEDLRRKIKDHNSRVSGIISSPYVEIISQLIHLSKKREPEILLNEVLLSSLYKSHELIKNILSSPKHR